MIIEGYGTCGYGVAKVLEDICKAVKVSGWQIKVVTLVIDERDLVYFDHVIALPYWLWTTPLRFHYAQTCKINDVIDSFKPDLVHVHGVFAWIQRASVLKALANKIPVVVSPHGMLEPWLWYQKGEVYFWLKRIYWNLFMKPVLSKVNFMHAITRMESETLLNEFGGIEQILIPNAIHMNEYSSRQIEPAENRFFLFLGRLHPVKGVDILISAFYKMKIKSYKLIIAGPEYTPQYAQQLKQMVISYGLEKSVTFTGAVYGEQKKLLLSKAWAVVVPSYSEVVAIVNLESAASFTPSITTKKTGLLDWIDGGGLLIDPDVKQLSVALDDVASWSMNVRMARGRQLRSFVESRYSWEVVGKQWVEAYDRMAFNTEINAIDSAN